MTRISLLVPTRKRVSLMRRMLDSVAQTASRPEDVEVVVYMDEDDRESHAITHPTLKIARLIRAPGSSMGHIMRECYRASSGQYVMLLNDDVVFRTPHWDVALARAFEQFPDGVAFVYGNDLDQGKRVPTFPALARKACELMDGPCPAGYLNLHIESHMLDIFRELKHLGHDRIVYLKDIIFEHLHHTLGKLAPDETSAKKDPAADDRLFVALADERRETARELAQYIEGKRPAPEDVALPSTQQPEASIILPLPFPAVTAGLRLLHIITHEDPPKMRFEVIVSAGPNAAVSDGLSDQERAIHLVRVEGATDQLATLANRGAAEAKSDFLIFVDAGLSPRPGCFEAMVQAAEDRADVGVVGCKLVEPRNGRIHHAGISFYDDGDALRLTFLYRGLKADHPAVSHSRDLQAVSGSCLLVRRDVFSAVGGFDETLDGPADVDLCLKVREEGLKVIYTPEAVADYESGGFGELKTDLGETPALKARWGEKIERDLARLLQEDGFKLCRRGDRYEVSPA